LFHEKWLTLLENVGVACFEMLENVVLNIWRVPEKCRAQYETKDIQQDKRMENSVGRQNCPSGGWRTPHREKLDCRGVRPQ